MATNYIDKTVKVSQTEGPAGQKTRQFKDEKYISTINDPNALHQFASYNSLFTLSALSQDDLEDTATLLNSKPHDIILRSGGIGPNENTDRQPLSAEDKKIVQSNERLQGAIEKSRTVLSRNRDLYIKNVSMDSIPGLNQQRRLTSVTNINMEIVEPAGITLLERIRGAAINNGYLDHLDAPFLLTIEFRGFDEQGNLASQKDSQNMKRLIPIKIVDMQMDVNQGGTYYNVKAIPYNEFAYVNRYNYPRTAGSLITQGRKLSEVFKALAALLNKQNEDEKDQGQVEIPDVYTITFDDGADGIKDADISIENLEQTGMQAQMATGPNQQFSQKLDFMRINGSTAISKVLEEIMKGHPDYSDKKFDQWKQKVGTTLGAAQSQGGAQAVIEKAQDFYFPYFKIRSSVVPMEGQFDKETAMNAKKINFHVEPYKVHAYSLAIPGVSTGQNFKNFVFKTYNYIFTGENLDVLDLNINYRVAYFQARLKDFEATDLRKNKIQDITAKQNGGTDAVTHFQDQDFMFRSYPSTAKSEGTGKTGGTPTQLDAFLDSLTHPLADMVNIQMTILGDPAWISQSQFIPLNASNFSPTKGTGTDPDIDYWRANRGRIWNDELRCYNTDVAEPIILLNFRLPTDINDRTGLYELQSDQSGKFSGLYRVIRVEHNFEDGRYTNTLHLTRFNNQGVVISNPVPKVNITAKNGETFLVLKNDLQTIFSGDGFSIKENLNSFAKKFVSLVQGNVSRLKTNLKNKIKGLIS